MSFNLIRINETSCELKGPYKCPLCGFHMMLDAAHSNGTILEVCCPHCKELLKVPKEK